MNFDVSTFDIKKYDSVLKKGLSKGLGEPDNLICIEAAICYTMGLPHSDDPGCVAASVRSFKIYLNDKDWSSSKARAKGLRDLGLAQLGSLGVVSDIEFTTKLAEVVINKLIPTLFREIFPNDKKCLAAALRCEKDGTYDGIEAARAAAVAAEAAAATYDVVNTVAAYAAKAAVNAAVAAEAAAAYAAYAAIKAFAKAAKAAVNAARYAHAAYTTNAGHAYVEYSVYAAADAAALTQYAKLANKDKYLILVAKLALEILRELNSPGVKLL